MRRIIDVKELFNRLCGFEYDLLKYINKDHGEELAPLNFAEIATKLNVKKDGVRRAIKLLVDSNVIIADGENFKINWEVFKAPEESAVQEENATKKEN